MSETIHHEDNGMHSDEIQDIISIPPTWLLRWGIFLFLVFLLMLVALSAFIRYPDVVKTRLKIIATNPPIAVITPVDGKLMKIFIKNNQSVTINQPLAYVESDNQAISVLKAPQNGRVVLASILEQNQRVNDSQELFFVDPSKNNFYGEMAIPQSGMAKVKEGQEVLIRLKRYPYQEYGTLRGRLSFVADIPLKDSVFISKVDIDNQSLLQMDKAVKLKNGMWADADIITADMSLLSRLSQNLLKSLK
jgi:multidrug resistance efflux pump